MTRNARHPLEPAAASGLAVLLLCAGCAAPRTVPAASDSSVQAEIRQALADFNDAGGKGDLARVMSLFDADPDILMVGSDKGEVFKGRAAMEGWLRALLTGNRFSWRMDRVDISHHGDTAWAFVEGAMMVSNPAGKVWKTTPYRFTAVLVRRGEGWAWRVFQGSVPVAE